MTSCVRNSVPPTAPPGTLIWLICADWPKQQRLCEVRGGLAANENLVLVRRLRHRYRTELFADDIRNARPQEFNGPQHLLMR